VKKDQQADKNKQPNPRLWHGRRARFVAPGKCNFNEPAPDRGPTRPARRRAHIALLEVTNDNPGPDTRPFTGFTAIFQQTGILAVPTEPADNDPAYPLLIFLRRRLLRGMTIDSDRARQLLSDAVAGDRAALQGLLLIHYAEIETAIRRRFSPELAAHVEVEDLIQDVLVGVYRGIGSYQETEGPAFVAWLDRIAENCVIDTVRCYRRVKRRGRVQRVDDHRQPSQETLDGIWDWLCADENPPDRPARLEEARLAIQVCLAGLQPDQREAVTTHYFENLDTTEVAERMGRTPGAVRELMRRARENLKNLLGTASAWLSSR
jgi:RNA polymerase sigma-70 factor (ECF subfamily)